MEPRRKELTSSRLVPRIEMPTGGPIRKYFVGLRITAARSAHWSVLAVFVPVAVWSLWWFNFPSALGTFYGATALLITYFLTRSQTEDHFQRRQLEERFADILDRLADNNAGLRSGAADRLVALAQQPTGRWPTFVTYADNGYYRRAVEQLCSAVMWEDNDEVIASYIGSLIWLTSVAASDWNTLTELLLPELADLNRRAFWRFLESIAQYLYPSGDENQLRDLKKLLPLVGFTDSEEMNLRILVLCWNTEDFRKKIREYISVDAEYNPAEAARTVSLSGKRLFRTSWALAGIFKTLGRYRADHTEESLSLDNVAAAAGCFMCGVDLSECFLRGAHLQGAFLLSAYLQRSDLTDAKLHRACLHGAFIQGTSFRDADLRGTWLAGLDFETPLVPMEASARGIIGPLEGELQPPTFRGTNWQEATFMDPGPTILNMPNLDVATRELVKKNAEDG